MAKATQADREATNAFHSASFTALFGNGGDKQSVGKGLNTAHNLLLQAFAAHREAAYEAERARVVAWLRHQDGYGEWYDVADAIERGEHLETDDAVR